MPGSPSLRFCSGCDLCKHALEVRSDQGACRFIDETHLRFEGSQVRATYTLEWGTGQVTFRTDKGAITFRKVSD